MSIGKYFRIKSSLAYVPPRLEDLANLIVENAFLSQSKVFGREIKETTLRSYFIKATAHTSYTCLGVIR